MKKTRAWKRRLRWWLSTWYVESPLAAAIAPQSPNSPAPSSERHGGPMSPPQSKPSILTDILAALAFLVAVLVPLRVLLACGVLGR